MVQEIRGLTYLAYLTFRRQALSRKSVIAIVLASMLVLGVYAWSIRRVPEILKDQEKAKAAQVDPDEASETTEERRDRRDRGKPKIKRTAQQEILLEFADDIVMGIFATFLVPLLTLIYATSAFGDEREDRTLVYLLTRPLARWRIYLSKAIGITPLVLLIVLGAYIGICFAGGQPGRDLMFRFLPGLALGTVAYSSLFLFFGAVAPRPLIMSVVYTFLIETLVGNMPGTLKRMALSYHTRCLLYDAGKDVGVMPYNPRHFVPISTETATIILFVVSALFLLWGAIAFQRKEYRDLA
ncbi:ABC transporter permease [bacterium]|jgi:ABC-type Na+ efflux pump permease subunit|nr:ABC transporter permease [bacterium]